MSVHYYNYASLGLPSHESLSAMHEEYLAFTPSTDAYVDRVIFLRQKIKESIANLLGVDHHLVGICQSTCQGIGEVLLSVSMVGVRTIAVFDDEYPSVDILVRNFALANGCRLLEISRNHESWPHNGNIDVFVLSHVSNRDGSVLNLCRFRELYPDALLILDCAQSVGNIDFYVDSEMRRNCFLVFPAYKWMMGPTGVAFIVMPQNHKELSLNPRCVSHFGIDIKAYRNGKRISHLPQGALYENTSCNPSLLVGTMMQLDSLIKTMPAKSIRAAGHTRTLLKSCGGTSCDTIEHAKFNGIASISLNAMAMNRVREAFNRQNVICRFFERDNRARLCFSGFEEKTEIAQLERTIHENS